MTLSKWLLSLAVALALGAGAFFAWKFAWKRDAPSLVSPLAKTSAPASPAVQAFRAAPPVRRVQDFYAEESRRIGSVDPDPALTQKRLEDVARELSAEELKWLLLQAFDKKASGDGRFFAVYMVALSDKPEAIEGLGMLATDPVPASKSQGAVELERQVRAQAVEGLGRAAKSSNAAKDQLLDVVERQSDEFLRDRAHRALYEASQGKSVEEQDKAALQKVLYGK